MSKKSKKRTKRYSGEDAKHLQVPTGDEPVVRRYSAEIRSPLGQWWHEKKRAIKIGAIAAAVVLIFVWLVVELFQVIF